MEGIQEVLADREILHFRRIPKPLTDLDGDFDREGQEKACFLYDVALGWYFSGIPNPQMFVKFQNCLTDRDQMTFLAYLG